jgi:hypothetical protein
VPAVDPAPRAAARSRLDRLAQAGEGDGEPASGRVLVESDVHVHCGAEVHAEMRCAEGHEVPQPDVEVTRRVPGPR